jgi:hypothetical protein
MAQGEVPEGTAPVEGQTPEPQEPQEDAAASTAETKPDLPDLDQLLDRYDPEVLRKNRKFMGMVGGVADKLAGQKAQQLAEQRAAKLVEERWEREQAERSRRAALEAARRGDYAQLGQSRAREVLEEDQKRHIDGFRQRATTDAYGRVQAVVNDIANGFPPEVVAAAAEKLGELPSDLDWEGGFKRWLPALIEARAEAMANEPETQKKLEQKLTPALKSRLIAEMNGTEPVADSGQGAPQKQRQITDEQIAAMEPEEWVKIYDVKAGKFRPGYVHKPTRALDTRSMQVMGRGA